MKFANGYNLLKNRNIKKNISKKILLANTSDKVNTDTGTAVSNNPLFLSNREIIQNSLSSRDIRYNVNYGYSPIVGIDVRNYLLMFSENIEIKKAVRSLRNEIIVSNLKTKKYPVFPKINLAHVPEDKQETALAIQKYLDEIFYPKLWQLYRFKKNGLANMIEEYLKTGKLAYEIIYDNIKRPTEIINFVPIDPATLQKFKHDDYVYYVQQTNDGKFRTLHENQIVLVEWNEYDYGYVSYVDQLRRPFNIMRGMQTMKIMWFAVKSQVRMHIKLGLGETNRQNAIQKLSEFKNNFENTFSFDEGLGIIKFNDSPNITSYREIFTAQTSANENPEIEEINTQGPDLTEVDSLQFFERLFWNSTEIPIDRIDPNASDGWGFNDVTSLKKTEINFAKYVQDIRNVFDDLFLKPIIIQLTLKEVEIGVDLSLLDSIQMEWVAFNNYEKLAELEVLDKKIQLAQSLQQFGEIEDSEGNQRKLIPITWIRDNFLDFSQEQIDSMEISRKFENKLLGFDKESTDDENFDDTEENFDDFE